MKLIAGLGNPGQEYADTRHNLGFRVLDLLARRWSLTGPRSKFSGRTVEGAIAGHRVVLLEPMTYMNRSGKSVLAAQQFYKLEIADVLIVLDDLDLPVGRLRFRASGSAGGHRGLADIARCFGTTDLPRLRLGIGRAARGDTVDYVLSRFHSDELPAVEQAIEQAADAAECWLTQGPEATMNRFNPTPDRPSRGQGSQSESQ